jgi:O-acetylserine/cysteine efflux transporter
MPDRAPLSPREWGAILAIVLIWGVNNAAAIVATDALSPMLVGGLRFALGALCLVWFVRPPFPEPRRLALLILCGGPLHFGLVYWGFALADDLSPYAVSLQLWIPFVAVLSWLMLGERLGRAGLAGLVIAFAGVAYMTLDGGALRDWDAILVGCASSLAWAMAAVLARQSSGVSPLKMQGLISVFAAPTLMAGGLLVQPDGLIRAAGAGPLVWAALLWAGVVSSVVATGLMFWLVQRREAGRVTPYFLATPLVSGVIGVTLLGDTLTPQVVVGGLATLAGVGIVAVAERRRAPAAVSEPA